MYFINQSVNICLMVKKEKSFKADTATTDMFEHD